MSADQHRIVAAWAAVVVQEITRGDADAAYRWTIRLVNRVRAFTPELQDRCR